ncbi:MAG: hypothetical protein MUC55_07345 [Burkholderiales bacterium]|nr:hypothetical protein [Burkholderiales bacterium]
MGRAQPDQSDDGLGVVRGSVGKQDLSPRKMPDRGERGAVRDHHPPEFRKLVRLPEEVVRVGAVMAHQAEQRRPVLPPVAHAQLVRGGLVEREVFAQVSRHAAVEMREDVRRRVVQRVVEIENPGERAHGPFAGSGEIAIIADRRAAALGVRLDSER